MKIILGHWRNPGIMKWILNLIRICHISRPLLTVIFLQFKFIPTYQSVLESLEMTKFCIVRNFDKIEYRIFIGLLFLMKKRTIRIKPVCIMFRRNVLHEYQQVYEVKLVDILKIKSP